MIRYVLSAIAALLLAFPAQAADIIVMVREQVNGGPARYVDGDVIHVFDNAEIKRQWAEIDRRGLTEQWEGHDRTKAPLSDRVLARFLVMSISDPVAAQFGERWTSPRMATAIQEGEVVEIMENKRAWALNWRAEVPEEHHDDVENLETAIDLRGVVTVEDGTNAYVKG